MHYANRILLGLVLIALSFIVLWFGSPDRTGAAEPMTTAALAFLALFATGFIIAAMGLMGADKDYPALLSGLVLYFIVGGLLAVFIYVNSTQLGRITIEDADDPTFWTYWIRVAVMWPLEIVRQAGLFGYDLLQLG